VRQSRQMNSKLHAMYVLIDTFDARCQSAGKDNKSTQQYLIHQSIERGTSLSCTTSSGRK